MPESPTSADRRFARSARTRSAVVDALYALIQEGDPSPKAADIAARAGVALRSLYVHFGSQQDLYQAVAERATGQILARLSPIDPAQPLPARISMICAQRTRINEEVGPIRRAAALQEPFSPALARIRENGRLAARGQIARVFDPELGKLDPTARRGRLAVLDAVLGGEAWDQLRTGHGLDPREAQAAIEDALHDLLMPVAS